MANARTITTAAESSGSDIRLSYVIARLDRAIRRGIDEVLQPFGLTIPQFTTMSVLARRDGLSNAQLARRAYITPQSMNEVVLELERRGLLRRRPDADHRRILRATLTPKGRSLLARCEGGVEEMEETMLSALDADGRARIVGYLAACVHALGAGLPDLE